MFLPLARLLNFLRLAFMFVNIGVHELSAKEILHLSNLPTGVKSNQAHVFQFARPAWDTAIKISQNSCMIHPSP